MYGSGLPLIGCAELCVDIVGAASDRDDLDRLENYPSEGELDASGHQTGRKIFVAGTC
jgi:hypothetical protein